MPSWDEQVEDAIELPPASWQGFDYKAVAYIQSGLFLGGVAGCVSLLANIIGSLMWPIVSGEMQHPLRLIQIYLTFPFGEHALELEGGFVLALGCLLYLGTGMLYGAIIVLGLSYIIPRAGLYARLIVCSAIALAIWVVNFYFVLSWLQPLLFGGRWIAELVPWWVAALTHLVFGISLALLYQPTVPVQIDARQKGVPADRANHGRV